MVRVVLQVVRMFVAIIGVLGVLEMFADPDGPAKCLSFSFFSGLIRWHFTHYFATNMAGLPLRKFCHS